MNVEPFFVPYECHAVLPGRRVLVLAPHPDDEVFGCGAALAQMAAAGAVIRVVVITDGLQAELRRQESCSAARLLGYPEPQFLGWPDGGLLADGSDESLVLYAERLGKLQQLVAEFEPDLIVAPSIWEMHRDHRAVAQWALAILVQDQELMQGQKLVSCQLAFYEVGVPLSPNFLVDITVTKTQKDQAMACFGSQLSQQAYSDQIRGLNCFRSYTLGLQVKAAEAYYLLAAADAQSFAVSYSPERLSQSLLQAERELIQQAATRIQAEQSLTGTQQALIDTQQALIDAQQELSDVQQKQQLLLGSLSWRITSPLRGLKAAVARLLSRLSS